MFSSGLILIISNQGDRYPICYTTTFSQNLGKSLKKRNLSCAFNFEATVNLPTIIFGASIFTPMHLHVDSVLMAYYFWVHVVQKKRM